MEAYVHMSGYVGGEVEYRNNSVPTASFRLACTPRVRRGGDWSDGETTWLTVTCFRSLAENTAASVGKGDPVVVVGRLRTQVWVKDGQQQERTVLEALTIGHDLTRGTTAFSRNERPQVSEDAGGELADMIASVESRQAAGDEGLAEGRRQSKAA